MPGATTTTTTTTATSIMQRHTASNEDKKIEAYTCSLCDSEFANCEQQRKHFKGEWHVFNLRRKIEFQFSITEEEFQESLSRSSGARKAVEQGWDEESPLGQYMESKKLRHATLASSTIGSSDGGQFSESEDDSVDGNDQSESAECETPGALNEKETYTVNRAITWRDENQMKLWNGKVIGTKSCVRTLKRHFYHPVSPTIDPDIALLHHATQPRSLTLASPALVSSSFPIPHHHRQLSRRDNMGALGLSGPQRKALLAKERKMVGLEMRTKGGWEASVESKANSQKHYRIGGSRGGKKMGGLEKRLG